MSDRVSVWCCFWSEPGRLLWLIQALSLSLQNCQPQKKGWGLTVISAWIILLLNLHPPQTVPWWLGEARADPCRTVPNTKGSVWDGAMGAAPPCFFSRKVHPLPYPPLGTVSPVRVRSWSLQDLLLPLCWSRESKHVARSQPRKEGDGCWGGWEPGQVWVR